MIDRNWDEIVEALHDLDDIDAAVRAAERLHRSATPDDVPRLLRLLQDESFFVREAAAWPLSELAGPQYLPELLQAYQRGFDQRHDNDGFSTTLIDMATSSPVAVREALQPLIDSTNESLRNNATWLLEFCSKGA